MSGHVDRAGYADLVAQHYFAYVVLEGAADEMRSDPIAGAFVTDALHRVPAVERDLAALEGPDWRVSIAPSPATVAYCERMRDVCYTWPGGFVAHHYTRYLGDLSGGQYIRRAIQQRLGLTVGTEFYDFEALGDVAAFKVRYRDLLDAVPWSDRERARVAEEARVAYELNIDVLENLAPSPRPAPR